ncbi:hypothetical protein BDZ89DRAFT_1094434 [Hymenopellis radicata]|nr:hypothetical protein BDZ89DRAFT_1094434 [Hymenopellis radicata]
MKSISLLSVFSATANAYWLMGVDTLFDNPQRLDPIITPNGVATHAHKGEDLASPVLGGSNFDASVNTAKLRQSQCTTTAIAEDKSSYWVPVNSSLNYSRWANGSVSDVTDYLFPDEAGKTTPFPDDFRMISGTPTLRSYDASDPAQQAVSYLCLDYTAGSSTTRHTGIPNMNCPDGIRAQLNFPSCWDGKNADSDDHKSHVAFRSGGPDSGDCLDPKFPKSIPRIFVEIYWGTQDFNNVRSQAKNPSQPFVLAQGDATGYGHHGDFINGWDTATLQKAVDGCHCNIYGDPQCCADAGIFTLQKDKQCKKTNIVNERTTGLLAKLPGNNPISGAGGKATNAASNDDPGFVSPVYVYTDGKYPVADYSGVSSDGSSGSPPSPPADSSSSVSSPSSSSAVASGSGSHSSSAASTSAAASSSTTGGVLAANPPSSSATSTAVVASSSTASSTSASGSSSTTCSNDTHDDHHKHHGPAHGAHDRRETSRARRAHRRHLDYTGANTF